jgi:predicted DNA-binding protein (MmcQ/YjbR family)
MYFERGGPRLRTSGSPISALGAYRKVLDRLRSDNASLETLPSPPAAWDLACRTSRATGHFFCGAGNAMVARMERPKKKSSRMAQSIRKRALAYPQTHEDFPWGESAFKVKGKTFIFMSDGDDGVSFSVKLPASRDLALALPGSAPTHYGLGSKGWVTVKPTARTSAAVLAFLIDESFRAVAPKRVVDLLGEPPRLP